MSYLPNLVGLAAYMEKRAPEVGDSVLMNLSELLAHIGATYEDDPEDGGDHSDLIRYAYTAGLGWLLNRDRD